MDSSLREVVRRRAGNACEYCRMPQEATPIIPFHVEHIVSIQHGGTDDPSGLALACDRCNAYKGPNLTSIDPDTRTVAALFNPRGDPWSDRGAGSSYRARPLRIASTCSRATGSLSMFSRSHQVKSASMASVQRVSIWPAVYFFSRSRWWPKWSRNWVISEYCTTFSASCGGMNMTPPSLPRTTSPGNTVACPMRMGMLIPIMVEFIRSPAVRLLRWCDGS